PPVPPTPPPITPLPPAAQPMQTVTAERTGITPRQRMVPPQLTDAERAAFRQIFLDLDAGRLTQAEAALNALPASLLSETARAALIVARNGSRQTRADLVTWLSANPDLPLSAKVARIAEALPGADTSPLPLLPEARPFKTASGPGFRTASLPADSELAARLKPLLAADRNDEAERLWLAQAPQLSPFARADLAARIAWNHYRMGDDLAAWRMGLEAAAGLGQGASDGGWTAGLAAFRLGRWRDAAEAFDLVTMGRDDTRAAAAFWAGRSWGLAGDEAKRTARLGQAATSVASFYGLLARRTLGVDQGLDWREPDFITADWNYLKDVAGARRAAALVEIGQLGLADRELRHLAATAPADAYPAILRLAARLDLPATQYSLATKPPVGLEAPLSARYPAPDWVPYRGWRVPRALAFAHALQESAFATSATSRVGAKGLMQLMPDTRALVAARIARENPDLLQGPLGQGDMADPAYNFELGQTYLEVLGRMGLTAGLLPKVIAAYNAGPGAVQTWNRTLDDQGDPLLFIESIPYRETRHYVEIVLRNLWMYELRDGQSPASLDAIAQGLWPRLPGLGGQLAVKREPLPIRPRPEPGSFTPETWSTDDRAVAGGK
ncbi:lytic transglycosylase domain-containing protein, partial [Sandarakinorhabdus oryzae]|uniref:lytic transglycosylase domain-containing protein n=1 Tax=Sandarakinorhabdus oryzae TaxID=2675220 RepID=UPI001A9CB0CC